ncbi:MAG TPA: Ezrin/radixin/moesin family protein [Cyclobacteriaceae bacterium]|jgi:septation ring formation regulator EzrA
MRTISALVLCLALIFSFNATHAQLSKQEKKAWAKKAKEYKKNPESLKNIEEENQSLKSQVSSLNTQLNNLNSQTADKDAKISELQDQLNRSRADLASAQESVRKMRAEMEAKPPAGNWDQGLVFKVQIGAFKNKDLSAFFEGNPNITGFTAEDGSQRINFGNFRDYWTADTLKKHLREMGIKDAWVVPFEDGQRVDLKKVLEGIQPEKKSE